MWNKVCCIAIFSRSTTPPCQSLHIVKSRYKKWCFDWRQWELVASGNLPPHSSLISSRKMLTAGSPIVVHYTYQSECLITLRFSHQELTGSKSGTSYLRGRFFTSVSNSTSRQSSLRRSRSQETISKDGKNRVFNSRKRKGSILNVKHFIGIRKLSLKLKTVYEEDTPNQSKCDDLLVEEQKETEPTVTWRQRNLDRNKRSLSAKSISLDRDSGNKFVK